MQQSLQRHIRHFANLLQVDEIDVAQGYRLIGGFIAQSTRAGRPLATATNSEVWQAMLSMACSILMRTCRICHRQVERGLCQSSFVSTSASRMASALSNAISGSSPSANTRTKYLALSLVTPPHWQMTRCSPKAATRQLQTFALVGQARGSAQQGNVGPPCGALSSVLV